MCSTYVHTSIVVLHSFLIWSYFVQFSSFSSFFPSHSMTLSLFIFGVWCSGNEKCDLSWWSQWNSLATRIVWKMFESVSKDLKAMAANHFSWYCLFSSDSKLHFLCCFFSSLNKWTLIYLPSSKNNDGKFFVSCFLQFVKRSQYTTHRSMIYWSILAQRTIILSVI